MKNAPEKASAFPVPYKERFWDLKFEEQEASIKTGP